jgi:hypothetical protein
VVPEVVAVDVGEVDVVIVLVKVDVPVVVWVVIAHPCKLPSW